nr:uncharacterized protein LOC109772625 isoform X2 [Aegilops tauschii subsp. strangulata]
MRRCRIRLHRIGGCGTRCSGSGASLSPASCPSACVGGGVEGAGVALILALARCENSSPWPNVRTPAPRAARSCERTLKGCSWKMRSRRCEKNVDGMLTEDEVKKVDTPMMHGADGLSAVRS